MSNETNQTRDPSETYANQLHYLLEGIDEQHKVIDRNLTRPAHWRGPIRRELQGQEFPEEHRRVADTYNHLIDKAVNQDPIDVELLLEIHKMVQSDGGAFRTTGVKVGKNDPIHRPHSSEVPSLVEQAITRANDGVEPPQLAAARLHLELLIIHPFTDSNGRTARLLASYLLMRKGYYSTLLTCLEQHFQIQPSAYKYAFKKLREGGEKDHAPWLITALEAMLFNSIKAAWFYHRRDKLYSVLEEAETKSPSQAALYFDLKQGSLDPELYKSLSLVSSPIIELADKMPKDELSATILQVERVNLEEKDQRKAADEYTENILAALKQL